ncbi:MAG TPA: hypothetical protein PLV84_10655 [Deltaproteobacteria bacterium]|nr:hypothetical protein [Deltaproteobacteria bacterium]
MTEDEILSGNKSINAAIKEMLTPFDDVSQRKMKKAIRDAGSAAARYQNENTDAGARHKFREFIPAYVLNLNGCSLQYDVEIDGKKPDWLDNKSRLIMEAYTFERGGTSPFPSRVYSAVADKCSKYSSIADHYSLSILIAVYLDFLTCVDFDDCCESGSSFRPLFSQYQRLSGILFFTEQNNGFSIGGQPYGFMCLTVEARLANYPNWPFSTFNIGI